MKSIEARLNKRFGIDVDLLIMFYNNPETKDSALEISGIEFETIRNTIVFMEKDPDKTPLIYMILKTLK